MAETLGTLTDKLSITNLKLWHQEDEARRTDVDDAHIGRVKKRIDILNMQRNDLIAEIDNWLYDVLNGRKQFKPYDAVKMYGKPDVT